MADRVAVVALCWFVLWTSIGIVVGNAVGEPKTGAITGFFLALLATCAWPFILPAPFANWMDDYFTE